MGNAAKAAILRRKASRLALPDRAQESLALAQAELERLARRLQPALGLREDEVGDWADALSPLLVHADQGFRTAESRVLHDLQKVCLEHERGLFKFDLFRWCRSWGREPLRQPLPLLSEVMAVKHLQSAAGQAHGLAADRRGAGAAVAADRGGGRPGPAAAAGPHAAVDRRDPDGRRIAAPERARTGRLCQDRRRVAGPHRAAGLLEPGPLCGTRCPRTT